MDCLEAFFNSELNFVGIKLTIPNAPGYEIIINPRKNFKEKLNYYKNTYDEKGVHRHVPEIKIIIGQLVIRFKKYKMDLI